MDTSDNSSKDHLPYKDQRALFLESVVDFWNRFSKNKAAVVGLLMIIGFIFMAIFAELVMPYGYREVTFWAAQDSPHGIYKPPSSTHWFGTDDLGRDVFSRFIWGIRVSLTVGLIAASLSAILGIILGAIAGYMGGKIDGIIMGVTDVFLSVSTFFLILLIVTIWSRDLKLIMVMIGITSWPTTVRLVRAQFLTIKEQEFIMASRSVGVGASHIIFREILPNAAFVAIVNASMLVAYGIIIESSLAFLGLGDPNQASWGWQLQFSLATIRSAWWVSTFPGLGITSVVVAVNLIGDGLNDALNPKLKER